MIEIIVAELELQMANRPFKRYPAQLFTGGCRRGYSGFQFLNLFYLFFYSAAGTDRIIKIQSTQADCVCFRIPLSHQVSGNFVGSLKGPGGGPAKGVLEVGYQIGCGIEMTTGNGVIVSGNAGGAAGLGIGYGPFAGAVRDVEIPSIGANIGGGVAVSLKPGLVNIVPVTKKAFGGTAPWVSIHNFRIKIDGCVGQSFIRSYATLAKSSDDGDGILSWYGVTKTV